jgi:hypothetical protein
VASVLPGCALFADLAQFDGYVDATDAKEEGPGAESPGIDAPADEANADDGFDVVQMPLDAADAADGNAADTPGDADGNAADTSGGDGPDAPVFEAGPCTHASWPEGGVNLLTNPDFDEGGTGWAPLYGGLFKTTTTTYCGAVSGELTSRLMFYHALATELPTSAATYNVSAWVQHDGPMPTGLALGAVCTPADGGSAVYPGGPTVQMVSPNRWTLLSGTMTIPSGCATVRFFVGQPTSAMSLTSFPDLFADEVYVGN